MDKLHKSIAFAYPNSPNALQLGMAKTGCWYIEHRYASPTGMTTVPFIAPFCEGFDTPNDPDLIDLYHQYEGEPCLMFLKYGNPDALQAINVPL